MNNALISRIMKVMKCIIEGGIILYRFQTWICICPRMWTRYKLECKHWSWKLAFQMTPH